MGRELFTLALLTIATSVLAQDISTDGNCSSNSNINATCLSSTFGDCCSANGFCGKTDLYCGAGCQEASGNCYANALLISSDGRCGLQDPGKHICPQSTFGPCCSGTGWCGSNSTYCATGCQSDYGECETATSASSNPSGSIAATSGSKTTDSVGFKVGMAFVGIAAAGILGGIIFFLMRRRRRSKGKQQFEHIPLEKGTEHDTKPLPPKPSFTEPQELNSRPLQELSTDYNQARDEKKPLHNNLHELQ